MDSGWVGVYWTGTINAIIFQYSSILHIHWFQFQVGLLQAQSLAQCFSPTLHWPNSICMFCSVAYNFSLAVNMLLGHPAEGRAEWEGFSGNRVADEICWRWSQRRMPSSRATLVAWRHNSKAVVPEPPTTRCPTFGHHQGLWRTRHHFAWGHLGWLIQRDRGQLVYGQLVNSK